MWEAAIHFGKRVMITLMCQLPLISLILPKKLRVLLMCKLHLWLIIRKHSVHLQGSQVFLQEVTPWATGEPDHYSDVFIRWGDTEWDWWETLQVNGFSFVSVWCPAQARLDGPFVGEPEDLHPSALAFIYAHLSHNLMVDLLTFRDVFFFLINLWGG